MRRSAARILPMMVFFTTVAWGCGGTAEHIPAASPEPPEARLQPSADRADERTNLPELGERSTLSDYLTYAALNNHGLEAAFNRWKAALERIPQVKALPDPRFTYGYFIQAVETRVGPQRQRFSLSQAFPWFEKLQLRGNRAAQAANAEKERYEAEKLKLFYQVKNAYYEYYYLMQAIAVTGENLELMNHLQNVALSKYAAGTASYADVTKAQVELGKLEERLRALRDLRVPVSAKLSAALNRPAGEPLPWPSRPVEEKTTLSDEQLTERLKSENPSLKALGFKVERERQGIELAQKAYYPDFTLGMEVIDTGSAATPGVEDSGKDPIIASVSINLPIWFQKYSAGEREARDLYTAAEGERQDRENLLIADLKAALYYFRDAERKMDLYRNALIPKAQQSLNVATQGFEAGTTSFLDLIDAERSLLEFQLSYERAFANRAQRLAELEMLAGGNIIR